MKNWKDTLMFWLAIVTITSNLLAIFGLMCYPIPVDNKEPLLLILGCLVTANGTVINYFFGSSKGSSDKNELLKKQQGNES